MCEAAGYDVVLVETVGVGQSEFAVASMVDFFLVLMLAGAGDELQGIKKGILELADALAINKADGDNVARAERAAAEYRSALRLFRHASANWDPPVVTVSALEGRGMDKVWTIVEDHRARLGASGELARAAPRAAADVALEDDRRRPQGALPRPHRRAAAAARDGGRGGRGPLTPTEAARRLLALLDDGAASPRTQRG